MRLFHTGFTRAVPPNFVRLISRYSFYSISVLLSAMLLSCESGNSTKKVPDINFVWQKAIESGYSGSVLVRLGEEVLLDSAAGQADRELATPNTQDTVFDMGSLTKQFTGALVLALQENGLLSVEDPLSRYFNDLPDDKTDITIHQLLTHTAGLPEAIGHDYEAIEKQDYLERVWSVDLIAEPGTRYEYSNVGYSVIAAIVEQVSEASYESALQSRLLQAAGIHGIGYTLPDWSQRTVARGYIDAELADELEQPSSISAIELPWAEDGPYWNLRGNGGLLTSSGDLLKWHDFLATGQVLSPQSLDLYYGRHVDEGNSQSFYGYGWVIEDTQAGLLRHHDGGNDYYYAQVLRFTEKELVIITLSNEGTVESEELAWDLARAAVPELGQ